MRCTVPPGVWCQGPEQLAGRAVQLLHVCVLAAATGSGPAATQHTASQCWMPHDVQAAERHAHRALPHELLLDALLARVCTLAIFIVHRLG